MLLSHKSPDSHIDVTVEFGEGEEKVPLDKIAERAKQYQPAPRVTYKMIQEYIEEIISVIWRSNGMGNDIFSAVIELNKIRQQAYEIYLPIVEELCNREVSEEELSHCLDYLLDFADDASMLELYKKLCRRFVYTYPGCVNFYVNAYKEMWEKTEF